MAAPLAQAAAPPAAPADDLLKRPLYVFDLPSNLLTSLVVRGAGHEPAPLEPHGSSSTEDAGPTETPKEADPTAGMSCTLCGVKSKTIQEQRLHAKSDVHRFNMKRKIRKEPPVSEIEFEKMIEGLTESISGSEASSSEDDPSSDPLATLLRKKAVMNSTDDLDDNTPRRHKSPIIWLSSPLLPTTATSLGIYRAVIPNLVEENDILSLLPTLQTQPATTIPTVASPHVFLCMLGGGHFAAAIISIVPKLTKRSGVVEREAVVLAHKTFHRYTTRRKQGGSQSANDASKGTAHSAGSSLRRYNEAALTADIREVLNSWKEMLDSSMLLFIRATGTNNRRTLFGYDNAVIKSSDPRIRGFPFSTRRATQSELMRCFVELTRVKVSHVDEAALLAASTAQVPTSTASTTAKAPVAKPKPSKEEALQLQHSTTLTTLLRRSKAPAIATYLNSNKLPFTYHLTPPNHHTPTLLHLASSQANPMVVLALLTKAPNDNKEPADPTIRNAAGKTAFDLAGDKSTRDVFRVARQELGEERFDWDSMGVGSPLSRKEYDAAAEHEKAAKEAEEKQRREKETTRLRNMPDAGGSGGSSAAGKGGKSLSEVLGTNAATTAREEKTKGLSEEAKRRLEREQRARAAEERMERLSGQ
ncbi:hypothetical protein Dda_4931 [Drechslerella dactyloides]|uniref:VLRF1 domain-containing protein n=1 Tax=Drechslerella dactyloides TaxID=74499 RepID=A0AAD6IYL2_DREDA|nr:hypothetical protein Dda_4931 [Drechslerella dactyloides]